MSREELILNGILILLSAGATVAGIIVLVEVIRMPTKAFFRWDFNQTYSYPVSEERHKGKEVDVGDIAYLYCDDCELDEEVMTQSVLLTEKFINSRGNISYRFKPLEDIEFGKQKMGMFK